MYRYTDSYTADYYDRLLTYVKFGTSNVSAYAPIDRMRSLPLGRLGSSCPVT